MPKKYPFLSLAAANAPHEDELIAAASEVVRSGWYLRGQKTALLEQKIAQLCETPHCIAVSNGLDALRLIFRAYKELGLLSDGDKVIVPGNTYVASVLAVTDCGLTPVLVDARPDTLNLDSSLIERHIDARVKAIMPVHLYGTPCWDATLADVARRHNLLVVEDNAQAIAARADCDGLYGSRTTGGLGHAAGLSFYPTKNLGALGDAGAVVTHDEELAQTVRALANYGSDRRYHNIYRGLNCRIDEIQAAMLLVSLRHLEADTLRRQKVAQAYNDHIDNPLVTKPGLFAGMSQVWHQYVVQTPCRERFMAFLEEHGVGCDIHYATPPHRQPCYAGALDADGLEVTEQLADTVVSLPVAAPLTPADAIDIARILNNFV